MTTTATSLGLPPNCARLRPLTQLWLASRLLPPKEEVAWRNKVARERAERGERTAEKEEDKGKGEGRDDGEVVLGDHGEKGEKEAQAAISTLPADADPAQREFDGATIAQTPFIAPQTRRTLSLKNIGLQLRICSELWPRVVRIAAANPRLLVLGAVHVFGVVIQGLMPAAGIYCSTRLLDLVDAAQGGLAATWAVAMGYALGEVLAQIGTEIHSLLFSKVEEKLRDLVLIAADRVYIEGKLDLAQGTERDPLKEALVSEAGAFAGWNIDTDERRAGVAWGKAKSWTNLIQSIVQIGSEIALFTSSLRGSIVKGTLEGFVTPTNGLILGITFLPPLLRLLTEKLYDKYPTEDRGNLRLNQTYRLEDEALAKIINNEEYHNELVLYGLKDWTLLRWDKHMMNPARHNYRWFRPTKYGHFIYMLDMGGGQLITNLLCLMGCPLLQSTDAQVLIATGAIHTNLTLGRIQMCKQVGYSCIDSVSVIKERFMEAYQNGFLLAAVFSVAEGTQSLRPTIDFEEHRVAGGMRIEARNLTFSYGLNQRPVLRNINLVIEPGQSLAIVGFNGSGKTTLVKTLLGLHRYEGTLLVNDHPIRDYDPPSLHARMSCLFQDYVRYCLPLRDNVGIGDTAHIDDDDSLNTAIERGGAEGVRDKAGLDGWLVQSTQDIEDLAYDGVTVEKYKDEDDVELSEDDEDSEAMSAKPESHKPAFSEPAIDKPTPGNALSEEPARFVALSGGQWQRVAISRAFMRAGSADLIVFDEPSAALDPRAEAALFDRIHSLSHAAHATTIFISHRFGTVRRADRIAFMDKGRIVEYGTHEELMALKGQYFECFDVQRRGFVDEA